MNIYIGSQRLFVWSNNLHLCAYVLDLRGKAHWMSDVKDAPTLRYALEHISNRGLLQEPLKFWGSWK